MLRIIRHISAGRAVQVRRRRVSGTRRRAVALPRRHDGGGHERGGRALPPAVTPKGRRARYAKRRRQGRCGCSMDLGHDIRQAVRLASRAPGAAAAAAALIVSLSSQPDPRPRGLVQRAPFAPPRRGRRARTTGRAVAHRPDAGRSANISETAPGPNSARRQLSFTSICGFTTGVLFRVQQQDAVTQHPVSILGPGCASLLGIHAEFGRLIGPGDDPPAGQASVVVLQRRAVGADSSAPIAAPCSVSASHDRRQRAHDRRDRAAPVHRSSTSSPRRMSSCRPA